MHFFVINISLFKFLDLLKHILVPIEVFFFFCHLNSGNIEIILRSCKATIQHFCFSQAGVLLMLQCKSVLLLATKSLKLHSPNMLQMYKLLLLKLHFSPDVQERLICFYSKYGLVVDFL